MRVLTINQGLLNLKFRFEFGFVYWMTCYTDPEHFSLSWTCTCFAGLQEFLPLVSEVSCQVTTVLHLHFSWSIFRKIQSLFHEEDFIHGMKTSWSMKKGGLFSLGDTECVPSVQGKKGAIFLTWDFLLSFHVSKKCLHFVVSHLCFSHSMLAILHLTFALPDLNSSNVCLTPPLCFFCIHPLFQQLGRRLGFTHFAGSIFLSGNSLLNCQRWELRQGMDCTLSIRLLTPHWSLSSWEHRGLGFASFGLGHVEFEGEGGW